MAISKTESDKTLPRTWDINKYMNSGSKVVLSAK